MNLLLLSNLLLDHVDLLVKLVCLEPEPDPLLIKSNDLVDPLNGCTTTALGLSHNVRVATLVSTKHIDIKHVGKLVFKKEKVTWW